ncbi:MAG: tetratricopeptide repeat protein [Isosphaeraceae bacterium]
MGVALELAAQELLGSPPLARRAAARAVPSLEAAVRARPDDLRARDSLGYALGILGRLVEARDVYEQSLRIEPRRELTLPYLSRTLSGLQRPDLAVEALRDLIAVNPWRSDYRLALARGYAQSGDWRGATEASREAIRLNPELVEARTVLIQAHLGLGESAKADAEFQVLLGLQADEHDNWQRWYGRQKRERPGAGGSLSNGHP